MTRRGLVAGTGAAAAALALLLAACGGGGDDGGESAGNGDEPLATGIGGGDIGGDDAGGGGTGGDELCGELQGAMASGTDMSAALAGGDIGSLQETFEAAAADWPERVAAAEAAAPEAIADDLATVLEANGRMFEALAAVDLSDPQAMSTAMAGLQYGPEVQAAAQRVSEYMAEHCGIATGLPG